MRSNRLGCLTGTGLVTALLTALVIAGYAYARGGLMYNPGPLNAERGELLGGVASHAEIGGDCAACHTAPWEPAIMADRCETCHTDITSQMRDVASVHGAMLHDNPELGCRHCHPEHRGAQARLTEMGDATFPHEVVGFSLTAHEQTAAQRPFDCTDCHADDITTFELAACESCHRQMDLPFITAHTLSYGNACLDCHDGVDRFGPHFDHNIFPFQLKGKHEGLACDQCHFSARGLGDFPVTLQDCYSCHHPDDPHEGRFGTNCGDCHTENGWLPATFDHNLAAFRLEGEHVETACESCHIDRLFKGTPMDCYSCHQQEDEHNGQYGTDCARCHNPFDWEDTDFDHNLSRLPLIGGHAGVTCERCHKDLQFVELSTNCVSCHGDPAYHSGLFGLNCLECHTVNNWAAKYHGPHPEIDDDHEDASCRDCHTKTLHTATCSKCHDGNPEDDDGGDGEDDDD